MMKVLFSGEYYVRVLSQTEVSKSG